MPDTAKMMMRFLAWVLGVAMLLNYTVAMYAYGEAPWWLAFGGVFLLAGLGWTNPTVRRWMS